VVRLLFAPTHLYCTAHLPFSLPTSTNSALPHTFPTNLFLFLAILSFFPVYLHFPCPLALNSLFPLTKLQFFRSTDSHFFPYHIHIVPSNSHFFPVNIHFFPDHSFFPVLLATLDLNGSPSSLKTSTSSQPTNSYAQPATCSPPLHFFPTHLHIFRAHLHLFSAYFFFSPIKLYFLSVAPLALFPCQPLFFLSYFHLFRFHKLFLPIYVHLSLGIFHFSPFRLHFLPTSLHFFHANLTFFPALKHFCTPAQFFTVQIHFSVDASTSCPSTFTPSCLTPLLC
jgi:hypothetical protein